MEGYQAPGGLYIRRYIPPRRKSALSSEQFRALTEIISALKVDAVCELDDFAYKALNEECEGFISNLNAFFVATEGLDDERSRTAARKGLQAAANLVYLVAKYEEPLTKGAKLLYEIAKAHEDELQEKKARAAWNREFAAESAKFAPPPEDE